MVRIVVIIFLDEAGQISAELLSVFDIISNTKWGMNNFLLKDVLFIMILDYFHLSTGDGKSVPIPSSMSSSFDMLKLSYFVGAHIDNIFTFSKMYQ